MWSGGGSCCQGRYILSTLGKENLEANLAVLDTFRLLRTLEEGNVKDELSRLGLPQGAAGVSVPANGEGVLPTAKDGVTRFGLKERLPLVASEPRRRYVANNIGIVGVDAANLEGELELLKGMGGGTVVLRLLPLDTAKLTRQVGATVVQIVSLLEGNIAAPVADLDVSLELGNVYDGFGELESDAGGSLGEGSLFAVRAIYQLRALVLGTLADRCVVGDIGRGELDLRLLFHSRVGGLTKGREVVRQVLLLVLLDRGRERGVGFQVVEGDANRLLGSRLERLGESNPVVLGIASHWFDQFRFQGSTYIDDSR